MWCALWAHCLETTESPQFFLFLAALGKCSLLERLFCWAFLSHNPRQFLAFYETSLFSWESFFAFTHKVYILLSRACFIQCNIWDLCLCLAWLFVAHLSCEWTLPSLFIQHLVDNWSFRLFLIIADNLACFVGAHCWVPLHFPDDNHNGHLSMCFWSLYMFYSRVSV